MISLALVGCAHIHTPDFVHRLLKRTDVKVTTVWDHDPARAKKYADQLGANVVSDPGLIWSDASLPAAIISSETNLHGELVSAGATARKHLFVEKPLASRAADAYAMAREIKQAGIIFQTGYFRRSQKANRTLKSLISQGALGEITRVRDANMHHGLFGGWFDTDYRWMTEADKAGVGAFGDMGAHSVDLLIWLLGEVESVTGLIDAFIHRYPNCDETGEALLKFKNRTNGTVGAGWLDHDNPVTTLVSGSKGFAYVQNDVLHLNCKEVTGQDGFKTYSAFEQDLPHAFELYLDAVVGKKDVPLVPVEEAAHGAAVVEAIYQGAKEKRWVTVESQR